MTKQEVLLVRLDKYSGSEEESLKRYEILNKETVSGILSGD